MKTFDSFRENITDNEGGLSTYILSEAIHKQIQEVMDAETNPKQKLNAVTRTARDLIKNGQDTGLESDKPKKGSSRAVFFPKEHKEIELDHQKVKTPSVVKIAFPGTLDRYNHSGKLLGEHQNEVESDHFTNNHYGIICESQPGKFHTNTETGILPPHFGHHEEHHHLEMGRVEKVTAKGFKEATKTPDFPSGITHKEFYDAVNHNHAQAHGKTHYSSFSHEKLEKLQDHPLVANVNDFVGTTDNHPADMDKRNMGLWHHPITGKKHVVLSDFGYSNNVQREYNAARKNWDKERRGY